MRGSLLLVVALVAGGLAVASAPRAATAQGFHPLPVKVRPLHRRLAEADVVAIATVAAVGDGRYRLTRARTLLGSIDTAGGDLEVKRSPSQPLPLVEGDEAVLLLRGARSPYVSVDRPDEVLRLEGDPDRWLAETSGAVACLREPSRWPALYLGWVDRGPDALRELAALGLFDLRAPFQPIDPRLWEERARIAWDPARPAEVRRASARLALLAPGGARTLVRGGEGCEASRHDGEVLATALRASSLYGLPLEPLLTCAEASGEPALAALAEELRARTRR